MLHNEPIYVYTIYENNTNKKKHTIQIIFYLIFQIVDNLLLSFFHTYTIQMRKKNYSTNEKFYITNEICPIHMKISNTNVQVQNNMKFIQLK